MFGSTATGVPRTAPTPGRSAVAPGGGRQGAEDEGGTAVYGPLVGTGRCAHPPSEPIVRRSMRPRWPGTYRAIGRIYGGDPPFSSRSACHLHLIRGMRVMFRGATAAALLLFGAACDPILNVQGSFFP